MVTPNPPRCVLLAEDDPALRVLLASVLRAAGHVVVEVADGDALLGHLQSVHLGALTLPVPDVIVSDLRMPGTDGLQALVRLREEGWRMPMILMTAFGDAGTHADARRLGAAMVLNKPFQLSVLRASVARLLTADS